MRVRPATPSPRLNLLQAGLLLWALVVATRLFWLQVRDHDQLARRAEHQQTAVKPIPARRGTIYDRNLTPLAISLPVESLAANPHEIQDPRRAAAALGRVLDLDAGEQARLAATLGDRRRRFVWVERQLTADQERELHSLAVPGLIFQPARRRFYPKGELAASVLGYVGVDGNGLGGLELSFDKQIHGQSGAAEVEVDAHRRSYGQVTDAPVEGSNLVLTLDQNIQYIAQQALDAQVAKVKAKRGTVVVEDPRTGEILALANSPTFNPDDYRAANPAVLGDPAVSSPYEPGSVFKLVTISAALQQRLVTPDELIDCQMGSIRVGGRLIHENRGEKFGLISVTDILAHSSNVGAIKIGMKLGDQELYKYIRAYGFGADTGIRLPGESRGIVRPPSRWTPMSIGAVSMGQEVAVTPVQVAAMVSTLANGGVYHAPRIVLGEVSGDDPERPPVFTPSPGRQVVSPLVAAEMKQMMAQVVLMGTGKPAQLVGYTAAGKTGTAEKVDPGTHAYSKRDVMASFAGFAPINDPAVVILTVIDTPCCGLEGGAAAGPVFKAIAEQVLPYLGVPHDVPLAPEQMERAAAPAPAKPAPAAAAPDPGALAALAGPETAPAATSLVTIDYSGSRRVVLPDFSGQTVRQVTETCQRLGLDLRLQGDGVAKAQYPAAGTRVDPGAKVVVGFTPN